MAGGAVVRFGVKLLKMAYPVLKKVSGVILRKGKDWVVKVFGQVVKATRSFIRGLFTALFEWIWERVVVEDVRERIEQMREEYEMWRQDAEEEEAEEEEAEEEALREEVEAEEKEEEAEEEAIREEEEEAEEKEEEAERDNNEEEEEEETKWSKLDEAMERICGAGDPFVWGN